MRQAGDLHISLEDACNRVLDGYKQGLKDGGKPFNLDKGNRKLADIARSQMPKADAYWAKLKGQFTALDDDTTIPKAALKALDSRLPNQHGPVEQGRRQAGEGSLGRERFVEMTTARGSDLAAEVKAFLPSAYYFAKGKEGGKSYYNNTVDHAVRSKDPYLECTTVGWRADWRRRTPRSTWPN